MSSNYIYLRFDAGVLRVVTIHQLKRVTWRNLCIEAAHISDVATTWLFKLFRQWSTRTWMSLLSKEATRFWGSSTLFRNGVGYRHEAIFYMFYQHIEIGDDCTYHFILHTLQINFWEWSGAVSLQFLQTLLPQPGQWAPLFHSRPSLIEHVEQNGFPWKTSCRCLWIS